MPCSPACCASGNQLLGQGPEMPHSRLLCTSSAGLTRVLIIHLGLKSAPRQGPLKSALKIAKSKGTGEQGGDRAQGKENGILHRDACGRQKIWVLALSQSSARTKKHLQKQTENFWLNTRTGAEQAEVVSSSPPFQDIIDFLPLL